MMMQADWQQKARKLLPWAGVLLLGALAYLVFGDTPDSAVLREPGQTPWSLPVPDARDLAVAEQVWTARVPWGAQTATRAAPAPVPVGIVLEGDRFEAVFVMPGNSEVQVGVGDTLPGGGKVTRVTRFHVAWIDAQGGAQEQTLFSDPLRPLPKATP